MQAQAPLTLYHYWRSSCSWRVRWALALKGVRYESVPVDILKGEHRAPEYLKRNPAGLLPTLMAGDRPLTESLAIIEWIDEAYPLPKLLPQTTEDRFIARQLALTIVAGTQPLQNPSFIKHFIPDEAQRLPHTQHFIAKGLATYEALLDRWRKSRAFSVGDAPTIADLCLIPQVYNALRFNVDLTPTPKLKAIYDRALATKECEEAAPHRQPGAS